LPLTFIYRYSLSMCVLVLIGCASYQPEPLSSAPVSARIEQLAMLANQAKNQSLPSTKLDLNRSLSGLDIARLAVVANPELKAARANVLIADAQVFAAGLLPDPQISLGFEQPDKGVDLVNGNSVALAVDLLHLGLAKNQAQQLAAQMRFELAWLEWLTANQARSLALKIQGLSAQAEVAQTVLQQTQRSAEASDALLASGDQKIDENALRHVALLDASERCQSLSRESASARRALNALLGMTPTSALNLTAFVEQQSVIEVPNGAPLLQKSLDTRFDLQGLRAAYAASDGQLQMALSAQYPLPQLSLGRARDTGDVHSNTFGVSLSLPLWNRARGTIAVAQATRSQLAQAFAVRLSQIQAEQAELLASLPSAARERAALDDALALLRPQLAALTLALERGDIDLARVEPIRVAVVEQQLKLIALETLMQDLQIQLETSAGRLLWAAH